jgi:hypothetical protein
MAKKSTPRHGKTVWCDRIIWVWEEKTGWYASVRHDDKFKGSEAKSGPWPSQSAAEDQICLFLTDLVNTAKDW